MPTEILNIEYHTQRLLIKALNREKTKADACRALGLNQRTFFNLIDYHQVKRGKDGKYTAGRVVEYMVITPRTTKTVFSEKTENK